MLLYSEAVGVRAYTQAKIGKISTPRAARQATDLFRYHVEAKYFSSTINTLWLAKEGQINAVSFSASA